MRRHRTSHSWRTEAGNMGASQGCTDRMPTRLPGAPHVPPRTLQPGADPRPAAETTRLNRSGHVRCSDVPWVHGAAVGGAMPPAVTGAASHLRSDAHDGVGATVADGSHRWHEAGLSAAADERPGRLYCAPDPTESPSRQRTAPADGHAACVCDQRNLSQQRCRRRAGRPSDRVGPHQLRIGTRSSPSDRCPTSVCVLCGLWPCVAINCPLWRICMVVGVSRASTRWPMNRHGAE
jgi:hypothetical protein